MHIRVIANSIFRARLAENLRLQDVSIVSVLKTLVRPQSLFHRYAGDERDTRVALTNL